MPSWTVRSLHLCLASPLSPLPAFAPRAVKSPSQAFFFLLTLTWSLLWVAPTDPWAGLGGVSGVRGSSLKFIGQVISWFTLHITESPEPGLLCPQLQLASVSPSDPSASGTTVGTLCLWHLISRLPPPRSSALGLFQANISPTSSCSATKTLPSGRPIESYGQPEVLSLSDTSIRDRLSCLEPVSEQGVLPMMLHAPLNTFIQPFGILTTLFAAKNIPRNIPSIRSDELQTWQRN